MTAIRVSGTPLQYLTGEQAFLDHVYRVTPDVLIPRPETETLATVAFAELSLGQPLILGLEIGLGSGILSIELLAHFPHLQMMASEASPGAIKISQLNASAILGPGASRLSIVEVRNRMQVCEPLSERLAGSKADFLISNPPYLAHAGEAEEQVASHEPALALWSPEADPAYFYRAIARDAKDLLADHAPIFVEIPHERAHEIRGVFTSQGWGVTMKHDLTGRDRVLIAHRKA
jgi:release factor glutamine methyltransferase